ncbi:hypothetical protein I4U23_013605 [Adineta vaga]|nr:hypothetical protein I4U23_013605 [Adineta vaga]
MKSIYMLCSLFIILSVVDTVLSCSEGKVRFYDLLRQSMNKKYDELSSEFRNRQSILATTIKAENQPLTSAETDETVDEEKRDAWDSGEDQYFKWASLNRRPMESLGRKRFADIISQRSRPTRIGGGIWRSGLVG